MGDVASGNLVAHAIRGVEQMRRFLFLLPCLVALAIVAQAFGRSDGRRPPTETLRGHLFEPAVRGFSPARLRQLRVPDGFRVNVFARGLKNARIMVVAPSGTIYRTRPVVRPGGGGAARAEAAREPDAKRSRRVRCRTIRRGRDLDVARGR